MRRLWFLSLLLLLGGRVVAQQPRIVDLPPDLGLSAGQLQRVREIGLTSQRKAIRLRADLKLARLDLRALLEAEHPDKGAIYKKLDEIGALRTKLEKNRIEARLEVRKLLNSEQQKKLQEAERKWQRRWGWPERRHPLLWRPCWPPPRQPHPPQPR